jgi:large subunit ribosomal protein L9
MLVILKESVKNLGRIGDVVNVSEGYARNYLLPKKLVMIAGEGNIKMIENQKRSLAKKRAASHTQSQEAAKKLEGVTIALTRKVGENEKLFGSVTPHDISVALEKAGHKIEKSFVKLDHPIKALGSFDVTIQLEADVAATIKLNVNKE